MAKYGPGDYEPIIGVTYWTFRLMVGAGTLMFLMMLWGLWAWWRGTLETPKWFLQAGSSPAVALPFIANRHRVVVYRDGAPAVGGVRTDAHQERHLSEHYARSTCGCRSSCSPLIYGVLGAIAVWLTVRIIKKGPEPEDRRGWRAG